MVISNAAGSRDGGRQQPQEQDSASSSTTTTTSSSSIASGPSESGDDIAGLQRPAVAVAGCLVILPILYRLGLGSSLLILVLAVGLNAVAEVRQLFDAFLGYTPTGQSRLTLIDGLHPREEKRNASLAQSSTLDAEKQIFLDVGEVLEPPLSRLVALIQRDFVGYWYDSSVALSPHTSFPKHTQSLLNGILNNLVARMKRQDPKEVSVYLFHSLSSAIIARLRNDGSKTSPDDVRKEKDILIKRVRRTSEELMLTLAPRSATASPLILSLLTEVMSLQIWSTIQSLNSDYINTTVVNNLGEAVSIAKKVQRETKAREEPLLVDVSSIASGDLSVGSQAAASKSVSDQHNSVHDSKTPAPAESGIREHTPEVISFNDPEHTISLSALPNMIPSLSTDFSPRSSIDTSQRERLSTPPSSQPGSPRSTQRKRLEDQTLEEALDMGAARLKAFGKNIMSAGHKFLDAALPPDETPSDISMANNNRTRTLPTSRSGVGGITGAGPSRKGKERERDSVEPQSPQSAASSLRSPSPTTSFRAASMEPGSSRASISSGPRAASSRPASIVGRSGTMSQSSSSIGSFFSSSPAPAQPPSATVPMTPALRVQRALDTFEQGSSELHAKHIKQIEFSLFSRDLSLLFPEDPPDGQLKAILARHTASDEAVDPSLIEMSDEFHAYLERDDDEGKTGELLLRMWTLLDHFGYMVDITHSTEAQVKEDALQLLKKVVGQAQDLEAAFKRESTESENTEALEKSFWTAVEMAVLRLEQNPNREIFDPVKDWLLRYIQDAYWIKFLKASGTHAGLLAPVISPPRITRVPSASTSKRTLDVIAATTTPSRHVDDSFDLGDSMRDEEEHFSPSRLPIQASPSRQTPSAPSTPLSSLDLATPLAETTNNMLGNQQAAQSEELATPDKPLTNDPPSFSVTLTDLSPPSAYQNNHVKNRKDLEFLIAVEVVGSPGYILARKYMEFEKMDHGIKKALPQSGTKGFPRAPLPSTNFQTSENLCRSLENYLEALLRDSRYAVCEPVAVFFQKDRTDSKGGPINPLAFLGQGVNNIGKGVNNIGKGVTEVGRGIGRSGEFAGRSLATGFNQFTTVVTGIPNLKRSSSGNVDGLSSPGTPGKGNSLSIDGDRDSSGSLSRPSSESLTAPSSSSERHGLKSPSSSSLATSTMTSVPESEDSEALDVSEQAAPTLAAGPVVTSVPAVPPPLPPRPSSPDGYEVPDEKIQDPEHEDEKAQFEVLQAVIEEPALPAIPEGMSYVPRVKHKSSPGASNSSPVVSNHEAGLDVETLMSRITSSDGRMSFDELLAKDRELQRQMAEKEEAREAVAAEAEEVKASSHLSVPSDTGKKSSSSTSSGTQTPSSKATQVNLSINEFNNVLSFAMAILEEAYELSDSTWNIRKGILRVLETVLRTSYAGVIKAAVTKLVQTVSEETFYADNINKLRESFWPPPDDVWWSSIEGYKPETPRSALEKEETRKEAKKLLQQQAPEGLKVTLGATATTVAVSRIHDALQDEGAELIVSTLMLDYLRLLLL